MMMEQCEEGQILEMIAEIDSQVPTHKETSANT
jgi:hypothetical protein